MVIGSHTYYIYICEADIQRDLLMKVNTIVINTYEHPKYLFIIHVCALGYVEELYLTFDKLNDIQ